MPNSVFIAALIAGSIAADARAQATSAAKATNAATAATATTFGSEWILRALARPAPMRTDFVEVRDSPMLKAPLRLSGE